MAVYWRSYASDSASLRMRNLTLCLLLTIILSYGIGCRMIYSNVEKFAHEAQAAYGGDPIPALITMAGDESAGYEERNRAVWALGQIGDKRALTVLHSLHTHEIQHPPYDATSYIVQHSVEKAIRQINGFTVTRWMYFKLK